MQRKIFLVMTITLMMLFPIAMPAFAQSSVLSITIPEKSYMKNEPIIISGSVSIILLDPLIIQIVNSGGTIIDVAQITPAQDGSFTHTILAKGPLWNNYGTYAAKASYGSDYFAEIKFNFVTEKDPTKLENNFEVRTPDDASTFDVEYAIIGGTLNDISVDQQLFSLIVTIDATDDGTLAMKLPRDAIDAKDNGCQGTDDKYIVSIDQKQIQYQNINDESADRTILIDFEATDSSIQIIGTCIIPEFGSVAIVILAISVISIITITRKNILCI